MKASVVYIRVSVLLTPLISIILQPPSILDLGAYSHLVPGLSASFRRCSLIRNQQSRSSCKFSSKIIPTALTSSALDIYEPVGK